MKRPPARTDSPKINTLTSRVADIIGASPFLSLRGTKINSLVSEIADELRRLSGATSMSVVLSPDGGTDTGLIQSSGKASFLTETQLLIIRGGDGPSMRTKRGLIVKTASREFSDIKEVVFPDVSVDSISLYPLRYGAIPLGYLVAGFWKADGKAESGSAADQTLEAAATQLSLFFHSIKVSSEHSLLTQKYENVLSQLSTVVFVFKIPSGRLTEANNAFFTSFGYERQEIDHLSLFDLVFDSREDVEEEINSSLHTGSVHWASKTFRHKTGSAIEMEVRGTAIKHDGATYAVVTAVDLTDRRRAEIEAEMQRTRYENFIRNSAEGIWRIEFPDPIDITGDKRGIAKEIAEKGIIAEGNRAFARMYGFDDPEQLIGRRALDFIADLDAYQESKLEFTERNYSITNIETVERDRFGNLHHFENSYIGETRGNELLRMWGIQRDITEKLKLQDQLRASEDRYRNLVEQANDMVLLFNRDGEFIFANKRFFEQTGYRVDEIWGKPVSVIAHEEDGEEITSKIREQFTFPERRVRHTFRLITKLREEKIVELSMTTLRSTERANGILAIARDVTVEQSVKNALHESEEKYRSLVEHSLLGVLVIQDDVIAYANPTSTDLFETDMSLLVGTPLSAFVHPNDFIQVFEKFEQAALAPNKDIQFSVRVITANGRMRSIDGWAAGITYMRKPAVQVTVVDVTDTKKLQEQLFQSQKMESIGQLASGVAHDFNNLLGSIYGAITVLRTRFARNETDFVKYVDILDASARRAAELTSQLLTFSRQRESNVRPVRLNDSVNDAMKIIVRSIGKNIRVEYSLAPALFNIEADPSQMEGIIINLCINSRDAMPDGGILRIETTNEEFDSSITKHIADARPGRYACLSVTDNGLGMDEKTRQKIFEPFFTTKPMGKGTGLGLSIVYGIVKAHRGFINVYSEPGQGTTFKVYIPSTDKLPVGDVSPALRDLPRGSETILLIDDEATLLDLTRELLEGLGYTVIAAEGALEGIREFKESHEEVDLVILDMLMPEMTGNEVYPVLKNIDNNVAVLLATGLSVGEKVDEMISKGVNDIVAKPYSVNDLATHVRKVIDSKKLLC